MRHLQRFGPRIAEGLAAAVLLCAGLALASACQSAAEPSDNTPPPPPSQGRWTQEFMSSALLVADSIRIEGPPALRIHMALPQDGNSFESSTKATDNGLLHVFKLKRGDGTTIRANIDNWQIVATQKLEVLERPFEADVKISAVGDAAWIPTSSDEGVKEKRAPTLNIVGRLER